MLRGRWGPVSRAGIERSWMSALIDAAWRRRPTPARSHARLQRFSRRHFVAFDVPARDADFTQRRAPVRHVRGLEVRLEMRQALPFFEDAEHTRVFQEYNQFLIFGSFQD